MALYTKKMNAPPEETDGIRICIMRNRNVYNRHLKPFQEKYGIPMLHMHIKELGPTPELKTAYQNGEKTWDEYIPIYHQDTLEKESNLVKAIAKEAKKRNITVLCTEPYTKKNLQNGKLKCHRRLFAEECQKYEPDLKIIIK